MFKELNPLLHSELRLAVMSCLLVSKRQTLSLSGNRRGQRRATSACRLINSIKQGMWR